MRAPASRNLLRRGDSSSVDETSATGLSHSAVAIAMSDLFRCVLAQDSARPEDHRNDQHAEDHGGGPLSAPARDVFAHESVAELPDHSDRESAQHRTVQIANPAD